MNIIKHAEFFDPTECKEAIHIIGVGAVGSHIAELIARIGIEEEIYLYDFDKVDDTNVCTQMFFESDIGKPKTEATKNLMLMINKSIDVITFNKGYTDQALSGHVFLCADNVDTCKSIVKDNKQNDKIKAMYDCRLLLTSAQCYVTAWNNKESVNNFYNSMNFTREEAKKATPVGACGSGLAVIPTIKSITSLCVAQFININLGKKIQSTILIDPFKGAIVTI